MTNFQFTDYERVVKQSDLDTTPEYWWECGVWPVYLFCMVHDSIRERSISCAVNHQSDIQIRTEQG